MKMFIPRPKLEKLCHQQHFHRGCEYMDMWKHPKHLYQILRARDASRSHILQRHVK